MLDVTSERHRVMAGNLANVDTPGFRRVDIAPEFQAELSRSIAEGRNIAQTAQGLSFTQEEGLPATRGDGNNVSLERELMLISENALRYEALTDFVSSSLSRLKTAISGKI